MPSMIEIWDRNSACCDCEARVAAATGAGCADAAPATARHEGTSRTPRQVLESLTIEPPGEGPRVDARAFTT
jgi:hypothetical protein